MEVLSSSFGRTGTKWATPITTTFSLTQASEEPQAHPHFSSVPSVFPPLPASSKVSNSFMIPKTEHQLFTEMDLSFLNDCHDELSQVPSSCKGEPQLMIVHEDKNFDMDDGDITCKPQGLGASPDLNIVRGYDDSDEASSNGDFENDLCFPRFSAVLGQGAIGDTGGEKTSIMTKCQCSEGREHQRQGMCVLSDGWDTIDCEKNDSKQKDMVKQEVKLQPKIRRRRDIDWRVRGDKKAFQKVLRNRQAAARSNEKRRHIRRQYQAEMEQLIDERERLETRKEELVKMNIKLKQRLAKVYTML